MIGKADAASDGNGPSPVVYNKIPDWLKMTPNLYPGRGWGFFNNFIQGGLELPGTIITDVANAGTVTHLDETGGGIVLTPAGAANDGVEIQSCAGFYPDDGWRLAFGARVTPLDADQQEVLVGLMTKDTDCCGSPPNDIIALGTVDEATSLLYYCTHSNVGADGTDTTEDLADTTAARLEMFVDEENEVKFYKDCVLLVTYTSGDYIPDDVQLAMTVGTQAGEGIANTLKVYWWYCFQWKING